MKKLIIILLCLCLCLISCKSVELKKDSDSPIYTVFNTKVENENNIAYLDSTFDGDSIGYSILNHRGEVETGIVYQLDDNCLEKFINIANYINSDMQYNLLVFVNYKQVTFKVEDKENDVFSAFIQKNSALQIPVKIDSLAPGFNDILFLIVPDANHISNIDAGGFHGEILSLRCNAILGTDDMLSRPNSLKLTTINETRHSMSILDKNNNEFFDFNSCNLSINTEKQLFMCIRNETSHDEDFVLILLDNWKQISLGEKDFELVTVEPDSSGIFPVSVLFDKEGNHKLAAIAINNPYKNYDFLSMDIESSQWTDVNISK